MWQLVLNSEMNVQITVLLCGLCQQCLHSHHYGELKYIISLFTEIYFYFILGFTIRRHLAANLTLRSMDHILTLMEGQGTGSAVSRWSGGKNTADISSKVILELQCSNLSCNYVLQGYHMNTVSSCGPKKKTLWFLEFL